MADDPHKETFFEARRKAQDGAHDEAITLCESILADNPTHRGALDLLGFAHFFKGELATAESYCRRTLEAHPNHAYAFKGLGLCLARQDRLDEGLAHLNKAMALQPDYFCKDLAEVVHLIDRISIVLGAAGDQDFESRLRK